ncbi:hypothetical protein SALBM217S_00261 [Streptomyces griseoloalbus]
MLGDPVGGGQVRAGADHPVHTRVADVGVVEEAQAGLQAQHAQDRFVEAGLRRLAVPHGLEDRVPRDVQGRRVEQLVHARLQRQHRHPVVAVLGRTPSMPRESVTTTPS